jgi:hypothetical protein
MPWMGCWIVCIVSTTITAVAVFLCGCCDYEARDVFLVDSSSEYSDNGPESEEDGESFK